MNATQNFIPVKHQPQFIHRTHILLETLKQLNINELQSVLRCNTKIATQIYHHYALSHLNQQVIPAILSYEGIMFQYMMSQLLTLEDYTYLDQHLRILSAFYGILRPSDGVITYRLELNDPLTISGYKNIYDFWGKDVYNSLVKEDRVIVDLASQQYSRLITRYKDKTIQYIKCYFKEKIGERLVEKGVYVKMARGEMVNYLVNIKAKNVEQLKGFERLGYKFNEELSSSNEYIFVREHE